MKATAIFALIAVFAACNTQQHNPDKFIFRYNEPNNIASLDPAFSRDKSTIWVTNQLYNGLLQMDNDLEVVPCIAKKFSVDSTATQYTFNLRNDVYFHANACFGADSSRKVTAADFVYSLNRLRNPQLASPGKWTLDAVDSLWAENDSTLHISLTNPFAPFVGVLTMKYCSVVPHEAIEKYGSDFSANPVGTGPFYMQAWHRNEKLVLRKNPRYFEKDEKGTALPYADGVAIRFITDQQAAFLEFLKGNLDLVSGLDASYKDEILSPKGELKPRYAENYMLSKQPYLNTEYLVFTVDSAQKGLMHDKRLRLAINQGFNRAAMMAYLRNNIGKPADGGIVPIGLPGNISGQGFLYDAHRAAKLVTELKKDYGQLPVITLTTVANYRDLCEYIQSELGKIGLRIQVDVVPAANLREQKSQGVLPFFRASWIADYPDAENYLSLFYGPNRSPNGPNYSRYYNPQFDAWYTEARQTPNHVLRLKRYAQMDSLLVFDAPIVPLFYDEVVRIYPRKITGLKGNALNVLDLRRVRRN